MWCLLIIVVGYVNAIDLSSRNLSDVPPDIPTTDKEINLVRNIIIVIRENAFQGMTELKVLKLQYNHIQMIEPGAFNGLIHLTYLNLWDNRLQVLPNTSILSGLSSLKHLYMGRNNLKFIDTMQLKVLGKLREVNLNWFYSVVFTPFPGMPNLMFINFRGNGMATFSYEIIKNITGLRKIWFGYNKFRSLPELGGIKEQIRELDLKENQFLHVPDLSKYTSLVKLDLSNNLISLVPEESLSIIQSGTVNLKGNPVICVSELCWLVSGSWPFEVQLTCPNGARVADIDPSVICEGKRFFLCVFVISQSFVHSCKFMSTSFHVTSLTHHTVVRSPRAC